MEFQNPKCSLSNKPFSLPFFQSKKQNTLWLARLQKDHLQLQKKTKGNCKVEVVYEGMMSMIRANRDYYQSRVKFTAVKKESRKEKQNANHQNQKQCQLPRLKAEQLQQTENQDDIMKKLGGMYAALNECKTKDRLEETKGKKHLYRDRPIAEKENQQINRPGWKSPTRRSILNPLSHQEDKEEEKYYDPLNYDKVKIRNELVGFLKRKQKERYKEKILHDKTINHFPSSLSSAPGQYVPIGLMKILNKKNHTSIESLF